MKSKHKLLAIIVMVLSIIGVSLSLASYLDFFSNERLILSRKSDKVVNIEPKYTFYTELKHRKVEIEALKLDSSGIVLSSFSNEESVKIRYVVEFGVFHSELDARVHLRKAAFLKLPVRIHHQQGKYRSQVGPVIDQRVAFSIIDKLKRKRLPARLIQVSD